MDLHKELQLDLKKIEKSAQDLWEENKAFRFWLRQKDPMQVNQVFSELGKSIAAVVDCKQCAKCCRGLTIVPNSKDIKRLADHLEIEANDFRKKYLKKDHEGDLIFKQRPCPFLKSNCCSVYTARPETCRSYPHLETNHMQGRGWHILENTLVCPIVFKTYEAAKKYFGYSKLK